MKISSLWQLIFILSILYAVSSMNVLILVNSILPYLEGAFLKTQVLQYFGVISFGLTAFLGSYHLYNMFSREGKAEYWHLADAAEEQE